MKKLLERWRKFSLNRALKKMGADATSGTLDLFLETLLKIMSLVMLLDKNYRRNIRGFDARYAFQSKDGRIAASIIFKDGKMKVGRSSIKDTNVTVVFKDGKALKNFLFNGNPDIIGAILDNQVSYQGNLNYLAKFAYMAKNLQLKFSF